MDYRAYIEKRSIPEPNTGCWIWLRSLGSHGYGNATMPPTRVTVAHRVSFVAFRGPIPDGILVQHACDNRWCVAPHHLSLGTDASNAEDKQRKGRAARRLTACDVRAIRGSAGSHRSVAIEFGIDPAMVARIRQRIAWKHVV